ncbi:Germination protease [[Clostridium] ultunense Esp]|uniref:Spore endopeptidase n=1 Tax=[Clostridium] ultunense Esp TaxID=1288971 RepID=M1ZFQ6_9FIRM|nr:GPR endopeptidase [Schnuerera ultunensis]CCQ97571.1 Germination protease [[Clostridium] ultunense Esp]SHD77455.1 spore endopeptidase [[Clostridium] ultunense Esp]
MIEIRTDLAIENREMYQEQNEGEVPGVEVEEERGEGYTVTRVKILDERGSTYLGKPKGVYITIDVPKLKNADQDLKDEISKLLAKEIKGIGITDEDTKTLIVGLGNWNVTPDALGPKVVDRVLVTRQFFIAYNKDRDETVANVAAISPGVMGLTGIETGEIVKGIVEKTNPDLVVAIDALASRRMERVSTTIQISDTGINPGSGIGNKRIGLNEEYLGVPVVAIGVPTVVDAATMVNDTMDLIIGSMKSVAKVGTEFYSTLEQVSSEEKYDLIKEVLEPFMPNVVVTPKEIDSIIDDLSIIIGNGLNIALHHGIDLQDVNRYIS